MEVHPANNRSLDLSFLARSVTLVRPSSNRFPLVAMSHEPGIRDDGVPDNGLESLGVGSHAVSVHGRHDENNVSVQFRISAVSPDDAHHIHPPALGFVDYGDEIGADVPLPISAAYRHDHQDVAAGGAADAQSFRKAGLPPFIIDSSSQFGNVVHRCEGIDSGKLAEVIYGVTAIAGASAHAAEKEASTVLAKTDQAPDHVVQRLEVELPGDRCTLIKVLGEPVMHGHVAVA